MIEVDWNTFHLHFLNKKMIYVVETETSWDCYTDSGIWKIKCIVNKFEDQTENFSFIDRYFNRPNVLKVMSVGEKPKIEETEGINEEIAIDTEDQDGLQ